MTSSPEHSSGAELNKAEVSSGQEAYGALAREQVLMPDAPEGVESVERRKPLVESDEALPDWKVVTHQWYFLTEAIRRDIPTNPGVRQSLQYFIDQPLNQMLPTQMLREAATHDPKLSRLTDRFEELGQVLSLPEIPEAEIGEDLRRFNELGDPVADIKMIRTYVHEPAEVRQRIQKRADSGAYTHGVTRQEVRVATKRYAYARDVKVLALGAELVGHGPVIPDKSGHATLKSGVQLVVNPAEAELGVKLLDPLQWEERKQRKDRVYDIVVDGRPYILKERKTNRHIDTLNTGHRDGQTSAAEYATGKHLHDLPPAEEDHIRVSWEQPVGYAEYPDGFQFGVFHYERDLSEHAPTDKLIRAIEQHRVEFEDDYRQTNELMKKYWDNSWVAAAPYSHGEPSQPRRSLWSKIKRRSTPAAPDLAFEDYAAYKAARLIDRSRELLKETMQSHGYTNGDKGGYAFRLAEDGRPDLEIIAFDYEYYEALSDETKQQWERNRQDNKTDNPYDDILFAGYAERQDRALLLAALEREKRLPPGIETP